MKTSSSVPPTLRFGVFELDPQAGELRKKGMKIRLQGQPVEILAMLLQRYRLDLISDQRVEATYVRRSNRSTASECDLNSRMVTLNAHLLGCWATSSVLFLSLSETQGSTLSKQCGGSQPVLSSAGCVLSESQKVRVSRRML